MDRQGAGCTGDIKLNPDTESVTVERRIRKRSLGIDKIVSPAVIRFTTSNKSRGRRGRSPGLILVDLAPALVPRYCRSVPFNEETSTGWTRPRFTFQHVPPLILLFDPLASPSVKLDSSRFEPVISFVALVISTRSLEEGRGLSSDRVSFVVFIITSMLYYLFFLFFSFNSLCKIESVRMRILIN